MSPYHKRVLGMLALLELTIVLDFMVLAPLGASLMPALQLTPREFGRVVSVYALSAGAAGILTAGFADRLDRKRLLLVFYLGFLLGTAMCGLARTHALLLAARTVTGAFGGVLSAIVMAIVTDLFATEIRGRVMGVIQGAFAISQIMGVPLALWLANCFDWHAPFFAIAAFGCVVGVWIAWGLRPLTTHLSARPDRPLAHLLKTVSTAHYLQGFVTTGLMATGAFMLMPFGSAFSVRNCGIALNELPVLYLASGFCALLTAPFVGRACDNLGAFRVFSAGSLLTAATVLVYARLGLTPLWAMVLISALMFTGMQTRMIAAFAVISAVPTARDRGAFMAVQASVQQVGGAAAAWVAGKLVSQPDAAGALVGFDRLGDAVIVTVLLSAIILARLARARDAQAALQPLPATAEGC